MLIIAGIFNKCLLYTFVLPAVWTGNEPSQIVSALLDTLLGMLSLDLVYPRLKSSRTLYRDSAAMAAGA